MFSLNSDLFHRIVRDAIVDVFSPIMVSIVNGWYTEANQDEEKLCKIILDNIELIKESKESSFVAHVKPHITKRDENLFENFYFSFIRKQNGARKVHLTKEDLFYHIFLSVARFVYNNTYLLMDSNDKTKNIKRRQKLLKKINKVIAKGIDRFFLIQFLPHEEEYVSDKVEETSSEVEKTSGEVEKTSGEVQETSDEVEKTSGEVQETSGETQETSDKTQKKKKQSQKRPVLNRAFLKKKFLGKNKK